MKFMNAVIASMVLLFAGANALAGGVSPIEIGDTMKDRGYAVVEISESMVAVDSGDFAVIIAVNGNDGDVSYLTYLKNVTSDSVGYEFINRFNNEVKFGRAYIDRDGDIAIQMDRNSSGGVSLKNVESDFDVFVLLVEKFMEDLHSQVIV